MLLLARLAKLLFFAEIEALLSLSSSIKFVAGAGIGVGDETGETSRDLERPCCPTLFLLVESIVLGATDFLGESGALLVRGVGKGAPLVGSKAAGLEGSCGAVPLISFC
jgi:hypothetical protein